MVTETNYTFSGMVEAVSFNQVKSAVFLPHHITLVLPPGRIKARGIINGVPFSVSLLFRRDRGRFFPLNARLLLAARLKQGDAANVTFTIISPNKVELPDARETSLSDLDKANKVWKRLPISGDKIMERYVDTVKNIDSRLRIAFDQIGKAKMKVRQPDNTRRKNGE